MVLVVTLALTVLVGDLVIRARLNFDRTFSALKMAEARSLRRAIEDKLSSLTADQLKAVSENIQEIRVHDFRVRLSAESMESRIDVGRLDDLAIGPSIQKLFDALLKKERFESRAGPSALDWIDADDDPRPTGAERGDYLGEDVSPRNAPFETLDELTFVRGFRDPSSFDRIRPLLTVHGTGKIYAPALSDAMLDLFENAYGISVRNALEDVRRNPDRELRLPSTGMSDEDRQAILNLLTSVPTAWQMRVILSSDRFYAKSEYILIVGEGGSNQVTRIG